MRKQASVYFSCRPFTLIDHLERGSSLIGSSGHFYLLTGM